jgi:hypothetical protein
MDGLRIQDVLTVVVAIIVALFGTVQSAAPEIPGSEIPRAGYDRLNRRLRNPRF